MKDINEKENPILDQNNPLVKERKEINKKISDFSESMDIYDTLKSFVVDDIKASKNKIKNNRSEIKTKTKQLSELKRHKYHLKYINFKLSFLEGKLKLFQHDPDKKNRFVRINSFIVDKDKKLKNNVKKPLTQDLYNELYNMIQEGFSSIDNTSVENISKVKILKISMDKLNEELDNNLISLKEYRENKNKIILNMSKLVLEHLSNYKEYTSNKLKMKKAIKKETKNL